MTHPCWHRVGMFCIVAGVALWAAARTWGAGAAPAATPPATTAGAPATRQVPLASKIFNYSDLVARASDIGEQRAIFRSPTATLDELEIHMTSLKAGMEPHAPHRHAYEEMVVLKEGTLEVTINGKTSTMTGNSVMFFAPNDLHGWRNVGSTAATYWVITWRTPRTATAQ